MSEPRENASREQQSSAEAGLCATCRHARIQRNARGSRFWRCGRADHDPSFRRYPPLPVRSCPGHEPGEVS